MRRSVGLGFLALLALWRLSIEPVGATLGRDAIEECRQALLQPSPGADLAMPEQLRLASWNIMKRQREGAATTRDSLAGDTDLLLLQEALAGPESDDESREMAGQRGRYFADGFRRGDEQTGVAIVSRHEADMTCALAFREPWLRTPKAVITARFPYLEHDLLVVNLHGINFTLGTEAYRRQLDAVATLVGAHTGPAIVAGDFNHWNGWRRDALQDFAHEAGLVEAVFTPDLRRLHMGTPVDSAFVRDLEVLSATAEPTETSDHHPLLLVLAGAADTPSAGAGPGPAH